MRGNIIEVMQRYVQSNVDPETNPVVVVVWREGEALRQKG
jgi:septum formation topological specificity factor MinE